MKLSTAKKSVNVQSFFFVFAYQTCYFFINSFPSSSPWLPEFASSLSTQTDNSYDVSISYKNRRFDRRSHTLFKNS